MLLAGDDIRVAITIQIKHLGDVELHAVGTAEGMLQPGPLPLLLEPDHALTRAGRPSTGENEIRQPAAVPIASIGEHDFPAQSTDGMSATFRRGC